MDKVKKAVGLKAYSNAQPLDEFRTEGNRLFLNLLGAYRCAARTSPSFQCVRSRTRVFTDMQRAAALGEGCWSSRPQVGSFVA
jgi:preprotein translocase subunit SecA